MFRRRKLLTGEEPGPDRPSKQGGCRYPLRDLRQEVDAFQRACLKRAMELGWGIGPAAGLHPL